MEKNRFENLISRVIGCMITVHKGLGPGFLKNVYRRSLEIEFERQRVKYETEKEIIMEYQGKEVGVHRLDFLIEGVLVVELKTVDEIHKKHYAQVRSYVRAMKQKVGLLANFSDVTLDVRRVEIS